MPTGPQIISIKASITNAKPIVLMIGSSPSRRYRGRIAIRSTTAIPMPTVTAAISSARKYGTPCSVYIDHAT